jgi:hypothetical protein
MRWLVLEKPGTLKISRFRRLRPCLHIPLGPNGGPDMCFSDFKTSGAGY